MLSQFDALQTRLSIPLIALGGTISMKEEGSGLVPKLSGEQLVEPLRQFLDRGIVIECDSREPIAGPNLTFTIIRDLASSLKSTLLRSDVPGAVVVQGTDTIEETAFLLDLFLGDSSKPVVMTGAMRGADALGADGSANMLAAIRVVSATASARRGVLVVLNDEIHAAASVVKANTSQLNAFVSRNGGPLGIVSEGRPRYFNDIIRRTIPTLSPTAGHEPAIALVKIGLSDDGRMLQAIPRLGYDGLIIEAMGAGHIPGNLVPIVSAVCAIMPVVLASRTGSGFVYQNTYSYPGSERELIAAGAISSGRLNALKARMLLMAAIACGHDTKEIAMLFQTCQ